MKTQRQLFTSREKLEDAINYYSGRIAESQDDTQSYLRRGFLYYILGKYPDALDDISKAIVTDAGNPALYCLRGLIYGRLDDSGEAWENFEKASELNPSFSPSFLGKAALEFFSEDNFLAGVEINNVLELDENNPRGYLYRGFLSLHNGEYMESIKDLKEAENRSKQWQSLTRKLIGRAFLKDGMQAVENEKYEKAVIDFLQFIESEPDNPEGHFHLGSAYMNLEEWEDARECFEKTVELAKGRKIGKDAMEMLEVLDIMEEEDEDEYDEDEEDEDDEYPEEE